MYPQKYAKMVCKNAYPYDDKSVPKQYKEKCAKMVLSKVWKNGMQKCSSKWYKQKRAIIVPTKAYQKWFEQKHAKI